MYIFPKGILLVGFWRGLGPHNEGVCGLWVTFMFDLMEWAPGDGHPLRCALDGVVHVCASGSLVSGNFLYGTSRLWCCLSII